MIQNEVHIAENFRHLTLKNDHKNRPVWVCPNRLVILETFSPIYKQAYDFLIAIAEPQSRPDFFHIYKITEYSLYAAASIGLATEEILDAITRFSKNDLSDDLVNFIRRKTEKCGKVRLVLKENRLFVESVFKDVLNGLLLEPSIQAARIFTQEPDRPDLVIDDDGFRVEKRGLEETIEIAGLGNKNLEELQRAAVGLSGQQRANNRINEVLSFEINPLKVENVKKDAQLIGYPMLEEYDFRKDKSMPDLDISLNPIAKHRPYQEKSLSKMFGNGRARSGMIVLPCGAGKTLVGITALATIRKSTLVLCDRGLAVHQWKLQIQHWAKINPNRVIRFHSQVNDDLPETGACIIIATYHMVAFSGKRAKSGQKMMDFLTSREWGLVVLDEVHVTPAATFRKCASVIKSKCKLGLTATLVREDGKTSDLYYLVGPKLYEANWLDLERCGYLAKVQCMEVWCPMSSEFYDAYLKETCERKRQTLHTFNPNKYRTCEYLIKLHEERGDKVLVFSDSIMALKYYARTMKKPFIYGQTVEIERQEFIFRFNHTTTCNCLFISSIGDTSLDMPDVNVVIQISSDFSSRRKEAQRLGRILRPKPRRGDEFNAFFYELVSKDTSDMKYAAKRQRFIVNQGYSFHVITDLISDDTPDLGLGSPEERLLLLKRVYKMQLEKKQADEAKKKKKRMNAGRGRGYKRNYGRAGRRKVSAAAISGDGNLRYDETRSSEPKRRKTGSNFIQNLRRKRALMDELAPGHQFEEFSRYGDEQR